MNLALKITLSISLLLLSTVNAEAAITVYKANMGCTGYKCILSWVNNTNLVIKRTDPVENAATVSPEVLYPHAQKSFSIDPAVPVPSNGEDLPSVCDSWGIQYRMRFRFYDQGYEKGYCDISFKQVCGWYKEYDLYWVWYWFTGFRTDSPQATCVPDSASPESIVFLKYQQQGYFSTDNGEYYTAFGFIFDPK